MLEQVRSGQMNATTGPHVVVTAFLDGTDTLGDLLGRRVQILENLRAVNGDRFEATATTYVPPTPGALWHGLARVGKYLAMETAPILAGAATMVGLSTLGLPSPAILFAGVIAGGGAWFGAIKALERFAHFHFLGEHIVPIMRAAMRPYGRTDITVDGGPPRSVRDATHTTPEPSLLRERLVASTRRYPAAEHPLQIAYLMGHGRGYEMVGGMPGSDVAKAMNGAAPDILLMESCYGANMEELAQIDTAKLAVASEEPIMTEISPTGGLPLEKMFQAAVDRDDATEVAKAMVAAVGDEFDGKRAEGLHAEANHLAAFKLASLHDTFLPALDHLGAALVSEVGRGNAPTLTEKVVNTMLGGSSGFSDMGSFLQQVQNDTQFADSTRELARTARQALEQCIVAKNNPRGDLPAQLSGLSFRGLVPPYGDYWTLDKTPAHWKEFVFLLSNQGARPRTDDAYAGLT